MSAGRCGIVSKNSGLIDGAQLSATPVVGWAQATTGRPPGGPGKSGAMTMPETSMRSPRSPVDT